MNSSDVSLTPEQLTALMIGTPDEYACYAYIPSQQDTDLTSSTEATTSSGSVCPGPSNCSSKPTDACTAAVKPEMSGAT